MDEPINMHPHACCVEYRYVHCANGVNLELVSCENGIAHDRSGKTLLWEPNTPGERLVNTD